MANDYLAHAPVSKRNKKSAAPYEKTHSLTPILFLSVVVPEGQASAIVDMMTKNEAALCLISHGTGTASSDFYNALGLGESHKQVIFSFIKENKWPTIKLLLANRFSISEKSKGVAFVVSIDSLCGVSVYEMLTNHRVAGGKEETQLMNHPLEKKDDYELIVVIVNDGYTDLVMDAAKKAGAHGGTILTARGTGNQDIEKFFGVVITPEKQIVMILVPKAIKDDVMASIYHEVGINTKGQGIAFSIPAADVVGIVEGTSQKEDEPSAGEI